MKIKKCENQCPKCDSWLIAWGPKDRFGEEAEYQSGVCRDCGCEFHEVYRTIKYSYSKTEYEE